MPNGPVQITISLTSEQMEHVETIEKLTGDDLTHVIRKAIENRYAQVIADEEAKQLAKINSMLDVQ